MPRDLSKGKPTTRRYFDQEKAAAVRMVRALRVELIRGPARTYTWRTIEDAELATLGRVHWHNTQRLHGYLGDIPPAEFESAFYATHGATRPWSKSPSPSRHQTQGDS